MKDPLFESIKTVLHEHGVVVQDIEDTDIMQMQVNVNDAVYFVNIIRANKVT